MDDKKKVARMLVLGLKAKPGNSPDSEDSMDKGADEGSEQEEPDTHVAAKEVMDAIKSGDVSGLASALKSFMDLCESSEGPEQEGE